MYNFLNHLMAMLNRSFNGWTGEAINGINKNGWCLAGSTLAHVIINGTISKISDVHINVAGDIDMFSCMVSRIQNIKIINPMSFMFPSGIKVVLHRLKTINEVVEEFLPDYDRSKMKFPKNMGTYLDSYDPEWVVNTKRIPRKYSDGCFFDEQRRKNGHDLLAKMLECGDRVGIRDKMFLAFGNLLGYVIYGDFLPNDDDIDMCILADSITQEQRHKYLIECRNAGLTKNRMRGPVMIENKYCWFSIGPKSPYTQHGVKSCNWFWFGHGGHFWHSKGAKWIGRRNLSYNYATAKGIPTTVFNGEFRKINFGGIEINAPKHIGRCLDWWYGDWIIRKQESSKINTILVMPKPNNRKTWYIEKK